MNIYRKAKVVPMKDKYGRSIAKDIYSIYMSDKYDTEVSSA